MVMWHITLHAQWRYRHTPWNALDLNAQPRGSYRRIDLFMIPPPNTYTTNFDQPGVATHGQVNWRSQQNQPLRASIAGPLGHC